MGNGNHHGRSHRHSYSEHHYDPNSNNNSYYHHLQPPPPPPLDCYYPNSSCNNTYPSEQQQQCTQNQIDRKYFNNDAVFNNNSNFSKASPHHQLHHHNISTNHHMERVPDDVVDHDSIDNEQYDIMPDPVPSVLNNNNSPSFKRSRHFDTISPTNINIFHDSEEQQSGDSFSALRNRMLSVESTDFKPKRNRMFSNDSDISAIELDNNNTTFKIEKEKHSTKTLTDTTTICNDDEIEIIVKEDQDPLCITDIPDDVPSNNNNTSHKRSFDINPNDVLKDFDMSYYVLQTLGDDIHDL